MKYRRTPIEAEAAQYKVGQGMEDGFELWADVVTSGWIITDFLVKITREDGNIVCPYISHRRGRTFIGEGDYIILEADGTKHVCGEDKFYSRFEQIEE
ncbi:MAG: hypothetical protein ACI4DN_06100 [Lachnospiraceae bacterium]